MRYYQVVKENFLWEIGAILKPREDRPGYGPINDLYKKHENNEFVSSVIVENCPEYFERVYKVDLLTQVVYETKEKARKLMEAKYTSSDKK